MPTSPVSSDHAYQSTCIKIATPNGKIEFSVGSWNMLNRCHSKEQHPTKQFTNNPYNLDESVEEYEVRKGEQFRFLAEKIAPGGDGLVFLQEPDCLNSPLKKRFIDMLEAQGYGLVLTEVGQQQPLALIFNKAIFSIQYSSPQFLTEINGKSKFHGFESNFTCRITNDDGIESQIRIAATNLHLVYGRNYDEDIREYQATVVSSGRVSIMGGDTNNLPTGKLKTYLGNPEIATNFSRDLERDKLTTFENIPGHPSRPKAFDCFYAQVPENCSLSSEETDRSVGVFIDSSGAPVFELVKNIRSRPSQYAGKNITFFGASEQEDPQCKILTGFLQKIQEQEGTAEQLEALAHEIRGTTEYATLTIEQQQAFESACQTKQNSYLVAPGAT